MRGDSLRTGLMTPVEHFYGIGKKRAEAFHRLGLFTARDLIYHFPRAYEMRGNVKTTRSAEDGEVCSLILTVASPPRSVMIRRGMTLTKLVAFDELGKCNITYFNQDYVKTSLPQGATFRFFGKVKRDGFSVSMASPVFEPMDGKTPLYPLVPVYPLTDGITQKLMGQTVRTALTELLEAHAIAEHLPASLLEKYHLSELEASLRTIHLPTSKEEAENAARRLGFDEVYQFAVSAMLFGKKPRRENPHPLKKPSREDFLSHVPYTLTGAQEKVFSAIEDDMTGKALMNRLIVGDVGSGKTVCAAYAAYFAIHNGLQAALMAPTEILARQHYADLAPLFEALGYHVALLVGSMTPAAKRKASASLATGDADLVIGTHALIEDTVICKNLGLAIIDEQHRFGASQRSALSKKGRAVQLLSMSATPIPRTLAMVMYCDTDVSVIDELPPGRQKVDTFVVDESYRDRLYAFIRKNVNDGGQVYIVCPAIEEEKLESESGEMLGDSELFTLGAREDKPKLKAAVDYAKTLSESVFPELRCAFLHGKQSGAAKDKTMREFVDGKLDILVSTTVIEVGVNVPRATLMIVENAEFFGLSALHQLRGRVGRGAKKSYCILVSDSKTEKAKKRLSVLRDFASGFVIAERDLEMRGPGDFIEQTVGKTRQSGDFDFGIALTLGDTSLFSAAFDEAKATLADDPTLSSDQNTALLGVIRMKNDDHLHGEFR